MLTDSPRPLVEMRGICKAFPGVQALQGVDLDLRAGEVHAVVGENGAGKSTLMKVLAGVYHPDAGSLRLDGQPILNDTPRQALERGVSMIQYALMCGMLSSIRRATAMFLMSRKPVVFGICCSGVLSG